MGASGSYTVLTKEMTNEKLRTLISSCEQPLEIEGFGHASPLPVFKVLSHIRRPSFLTAYVKCLVVIKIICEFPICVSLWWALEDRPAGLMEQLLLKDPSYVFVLKLKSYHSSCFWSCAVFYLPVNADACQKSRTKSNMKPLHLETGGVWWKRLTVHTH